MLGPYREGGKWRLITISDQGRHSRIARSESAARDLKRQLLASLPRLRNTTLHSALWQYELHLKRQHSRQTVSRILCTLRAFLPEHVTEHKIFTDGTQRRTYHHCDRVEGDD